MVNYVLSFCKITAASRIFSRNFYLPLLKPLTPKDALRTFRITGKWLLGAKTQHYIPVLLNHSKKRSKKAKNYGQIAHEIMDGYNYMIPILDPENENHRLLIEILNSNQAEGNFVYTVDDKKCNIILSAPLELAIRDGHIIDVMVSQRNDKILVKLANFKKIGVEMEHFNDEDAKLFYGEGATSPEEEKFHHHGKFTMSIAKIFEDKEREAEEWELELQRIISRKRKQKGEGSKEWREMIRITIKNLDWNKFEEDAKKVVDQISEPVVEQHIGMEVEDLEKTKKVPEVIMSYGIDILPKMGEIPDVVNSMASARLDEIEAEIEEDVMQEDENEEVTFVKQKVKRRVSGVRVTLPSGKECFVSGQMVKTDDGDVFVPGQTVENEFGYEYAPGFTVNMENVPTLIKGLIMGDQNEEKQKPMFLPTESTITADGQLTFATNKEERIKYKPKKRGLKKKKKQKKEEVVLLEHDKEEEQENGEEQVEILLEIVEEEPASQIITEEEIEEEPPDDTVEDLVEINEPREETESEDTEDKDNSTSTAERLEFEELLRELLDDGMDDLLANIEDKKASLQQKLEELRKLKLQTNRNTITFASLEDTDKIMKKISQDSEIQAKIGETILTMLRRIACFRDRSCIDPENIFNAPSGEQDDPFHTCSEDLQVALKSAVVAANNVFKTRAKDQVFALKSMEQHLLSLTDDKLLEELLKIAKTPLERTEISNEIIKDLTRNALDSKSAILRSLAAEKDSENASNKIAMLLEETGGIMGPAFLRLCKTNNDLPKSVVDSLVNKIGRLKTDSAIIENVKSYVVSSVQNFTEKCLREIDDSLDSDMIKDFLDEAKGLAVALGLQDTSENLAKAALDPDIDLFSCDRSSLLVMKKLCLMKKLSEKDFSLKKAITKVKENPERARNDPSVRSLVKEASVLISEASPLKSSKDVPLQHLKTENLLAIEEYLAQRITTDQPILITKKGLQAIVPREAARGVLSGRVAYVLVDESGISHMKPVHMLTALKNREFSEDYNVKQDRDRSQSPFLSSSRGSSPVTDFRSRKQLNKSRMVA